MSDKNQNKERGCWITGVLILIIIHGLFAIYLVNDAIKQEYAPSRPILITILIVISLMNIIAAIAMWYWKKWGLYLFTAATLIGIAAHILMTGSMLVAFYDIIPLAFLVYLYNMQNKLRYLE